MAEDNSSATTAPATHDLQTLLGSSDRNFLVNSNGDKVTIVDDLRGKTIGLYFSAHWCGPCRRFTPNLADLYNEINAAEAGQFEIVFVSADHDENSFKEYLSEMPWLAVPFSDAVTRERLDQQFEVNGIPHLVVLKAQHGSSTAEVVNGDAVGVVREYGVEAYPFSEEKVKELKQAEEEVKKNQTVRGVLGSKSRDYVHSKNGDKVPLSELEGKLVGILFHSSTYGNCSDFLPILANAYEDLKHRGRPFEVVLISLDTDKGAYDKAVSEAPWPLAVPFKDNSVERLIRYFELRKLPTLVILGEDGKTVHTNAADLVEGLGAGAYPFTPDKDQELQELERKRRESQTLESLLVQGDLDYVVGKDGAQVPVKDLVGKTVLIYFSAHWCPPCRRFTPRLAEVYKELQAQGKPVEVVFASSDNDEEAFNDYFASMPWLAIPLNDPRKKALSKRFQVQGIPTLVALDPSGRTATVEARGLVEEHGAAAYPFTESRAKELEEMGDAEAQEWLDKTKIGGHDHDLVKTKRRGFVCDICSEGGKGWAYYCKECDFDAHPKCALDAAAEAAQEEQAGETEGGEIKPDGVVCDGDVCRRA